MTMTATDFHADEGFWEDGPPVLPAQEAPAADDPYLSVATFRLRGDVRRIVYSSPDGSYTVLRLTDTSGQEQTLVGALGHVLEGQTIEVEGRWEQHREHGRQFRVTSCQAVLPNTEEGIRRYLASGVLPGIGEVYANRMVDTFGLETLTVLDRYSERLREVPGIGKKRMEEIRAAWKEQHDGRETDVFLQGLGLSTALCTSIKQRYGLEAAAEMVRRNPYRLAADVRGIGFLSADRIASRLGFAEDSPLRLCAGMVFALEEFQANGHVCVTGMQLLESAKAKLNVGDEALEAGLKEALGQGRIVCEASPAHGGEGMYYTRRMYQAEVELAEAVNLLLAQGAARLEVSTEGLSEDFARLNAAQRQGVERAFTSGFSIITGGPGVGKTTVVGQIVALGRRLRMEMLLAAPTGRAAKRLSEATGQKAVTIHRLLQWDPQEHRFLHDADSPLDCRLLVVDEVSMLDTQLASSLFRAVRGGTHVVLVGDKDQLPSVGPGAVLHDLIACGRVPVTELTEVYRQAGDSRIITNAHAVNRGRMPDCRPLPKGTLGDFYWVELDSPEQAAAMIVRMTVERIPKAFGFDPMTDVQVLSPMRKGECGTLAMNERLQAALNPPGPDRAELRFGEHLFRTGDRVMQTRNNYDKNVFNGEQGRVIFVDESSRKFTVQFDAVMAEYDSSDFDELSLAYAVTVHKSQGSEYPVVLMPVLNQHYIMLQRNLVYTGMTRAKKLLIMVGGYRALAVAVRNDRPMQRQTMLAERLMRPRNTTQTKEQDV